MLFFQQLLLPALPTPQGKERKAQANLGKEKWGVVSSYKRKMQVNHNKLSCYTLKYSIFFFLHNRVPIFNQISKAPVTWILSAFPVFLSFFLKPYRTTYNPIL